MRRILVLCVDRDDDVGKKTKKKGPFVGEKECLKIAEALALADPTESDVNAIYGAVKTYRELKRDGESAEVAVITGHERRGYAADKKVTEQLEKLLEKTKAKEVVFVSDGADDEQLIPIIQSHAKLVSVKTIIVKQAKELEKSYYVIKEVLRDPHFARLVFGLPGVVLAAYGIVNVLGIQEISLNVVLGLVGTYLVLKGFGIEDAVVRAFGRFRKTTSMERASFPLYIASLLVFLLGIWAGYENLAFVYKNVPVGVVIQSHWLVNIGAFLMGFMGLFTLAIIFFFAGRIGDMYYRAEFYKIRKYARSIVSMIAFYILIGQASGFILFWTNASRVGPELTDLFISVGIAFIITLVGFLVIKHIFITKYVMKRLQRGMPVIDADGKELGKVSGIDNKKRSFKCGEKQVMFSRIYRVTENVHIN